MQDNRFCGRIIKKKQYLFCENLVANAIFRDTHGSQMFRALMASFYCPLIELACCLIVG